MLPKPEEQRQARDLRSTGLSIRTIAKNLGVAKSSVKQWVQDITLTDEQKKQLLGRQGQRKGEKSCPVCNTKDLTQFGVNTSRWDGLQTYCRNCVNAYRKPRNKKYALKHRYGLTARDYERILQEQGGTCALCHEPPDRSTLVADHNHTTGKFRGLIHQRCNILLGCAKDQTEKLLAAVEYLKNSTIPTQVGATV
jgi:transposase